MGVVTSILGATVGKFMSDRSYWAAKLDTGKWVSELDTRVDAKFREGFRPFDWVLDLLATGDVRRIKELWLFCPPNALNPLGTSARLPITERGTAFQIKGGVVLALGASGQRTTYQLIGRVDDKVSGNCTYFAWDAKLNGMTEPLHTSIYDFKPWREDILPLCHLNLDVLGVGL